MANILSRRPGWFQIPFYFIRTVLKWQIKYCMNSSSPPKSARILIPERSPYVCQATYWHFLWVGLLSYGLAQSHSHSRSAVCVCFPLVLYLPHGQNMALAFIKTKCLSRVLPCQPPRSSRSGVFENNINHQPEQLFPLFGGFCQHRLIWKQLLLSLQPTSLW